MSGEHLTPGFFGKLPAAGDFVSRGLDPAFVRFWDRFASRHLVRPLAEERAGSAPWLGFMLDGEHGGPIAGAVMGSGDRAGRRFPLTVAAPVPRLVLDLPSQAKTWFAEAAAAGDAARTGDLDADGLAARLAALPFPALGGEGEPVAGILFWTDPLELHQADEDDPADTIRTLLGSSREAA